MINYICMLMIFSWYFRFSSSSTMHKAVFYGVFWLCELGPVSKADFMYMYICSVHVHVYVYMGLFSKYIVRVHVWYSTLCPNNWLCGPLPETKLGNKHILCVMDYATRFIRLAILKDTKALGIAKVFFNQWITLFGPPTCICINSRISWYMVNIYIYCWNTH